MRIKSAILYSLPCVVGVVSFLVAAHQVAPSFTTLRALSHTSTKSAIFSGQVVNRSLKSDRLPIKQLVPQADDEKQIKLPQIAPNRKIENDCNKAPIDVIGRCFADAGPLRYDLLLSPDQYT